jgi:hypothetical protein
MQYSLLELLYRDRLNGNNSIFLQLLDNKLLNDKISKISIMIFLIYICYTI